MLGKILKIVHIMAIAVFIGSIPAHIILGEMADFSADPQRFATLFQIKYLLTRTLTVSALMVSVSSGVLLVLRHRQFLRGRWLRLKLVLVFVVAVNAFMFLTPIAKNLALQATEAAASGQLPEGFNALLASESVHGPINMISILLIVALSVLRRPGVKKEIKGHEHG